MGSAGQQSDAYSATSRLSGSGRLVLFPSGATNLAPVDPASAFPVPGGGIQYNNIFLRDLATRRTRLVSRNEAGAALNSPSTGPILARNGRLAGFVSNATLLVPRATPTLPQLFVIGLATGRAEIASLGTDGREADRTPLPIAFSPEGRFVAFQTNSCTLVPGTGDNRGNLFVRDLVRGVTTLETVGFDGSPAVGPPLRGPNFSDGALTPGGGYLVFDSSASNIVPGDDNGRSDVFVRDRKRGTIELISAASTSPSATA
ncbi:MAG: hypothetical protein U1E45_15610 [Geminicoccaceae bacterium]